MTIIGRLKEITPTLVGAPTKGVFHCDARSQSLLAAELAAHEEIKEWYDDDNFHFKVDGIDYAVELDQDPGRGWYVNWLASEPGVHDTFFRGANQHLENSDE